MKIHDLSPFPRLLRPTEVAAELRIGIETVRRLLRSGALQGSLIGRQWRIERTKLDEFVSQTKTESNKGP
jgi:excisionase family DNA binding protein